MSEAAKEASEVKDAPKKGKKGLIIILAAVILLAGGGGGAWFMLKGKPADPHAAEEARKKKEKKARVFLPMDPFTVNLADESDRYAQVSVVLEVVSNEVSEELKAAMPAVRNRVLLLLSSKKSQELLTLEGKEQLAGEIALAGAHVIGWEPDAKGRAAKGDGASDDAAKDDGKGAEDDQKSAEGKSGDAAEEGDAARDKAGEKAHDSGKANPIAKVHFNQFIVQ